jgi:parallel beta-helix repeat protein
MKHAVRFLSFAVVTAMVASLAVALPAEAKTIDVMPGQSIQDAVDAAHPGDVIVVHPGVYHENVLVQKNDITLKGSGASSDGTVLVPPANPKGPNKGNGITVIGQVDFKTGKVKSRTHGDRVSGFLIKGFPDFGIFGDGTDDFVFAHNKAVANGEYGISGFNMHKGKMVYNIASGSGEAGFYWGDSPNAQAVIRGNVAFNNDIGIFVRDSNRGVVQDNRMFDNCVGAAVLNTGSPNATARWRVTGNQAYHNNHFCKGEGGSSDSGTGIGVIGARNTTIANNRVWNNRPSKAGAGFPGGILLGSGKQFGAGPPNHVVIKSNVLFRNRPDDISYDGSGSANRFVANQCDTSKPTGLCH